MKFKTMLIFLLFMITIGKGAKINHEGADSITVSPPSLVNYDKYVAVVNFKNSSSGNLIIDSVTIRFLNGDSSDFSMCKSCQSDRYYEYNYSGWTYGVSRTTLRFVEDSLFVLQDSSGRAITFTVSTFEPQPFFVYQITNCPFCGRMPSFPKTTAYRYVFHYAGGADSLKVLVQGPTSVRSVPGVLRQQDTKAARDAAFTIDGRKLQKGTMRCSGLIAGVTSARQSIHH